MGVYAKSSGTLVLDGVTPGDIKQGQLGDCFLAAALVSVADAKPGAITSMVVDNGIVDGSHSWGVRFFNAQGQAQWVTVNDMLPVREAGSTTLVYGANPQGDLNGEIWFPLIEKAYAQANTLKILPRSEQIGVNGYWGIEGGFGDPIASVLGGKVTAYVYTENVSFGNNDYITIKYVNRADPVALADYQAIVLAALNGGKAVWIGSDKKTTDAFDNTLLTGGHAFSAIDANKADPNSAGVSVWNPWGVKSLPDPPTNVGHLSPFDTYDIAALVGIAEIYLMIGG